VDAEERKGVDFKSLLISETVFKDSRKALKASDESVKKNFGQDDIKAIATTIIRKGELQLTTEQRRERWRTNGSRSLPS
jgi:ribosome maturation protein SDO1